jgi:hypothetical protein
VLLPSRLASTCAVFATAAAVSSLAADRDPVLEAIETLESRHDARCHSTASRFEDFLFGTPLSTEARHAHVDLQKRLALEIWTRAATTPSGSAVGGAAIDSARASLFDLSTDERGDLSIAAPGVARIAVPARRVEQYATIAYSLRAILGVEQDQLLTPDARLPRLTPEGVQALRASLDGAALAALSLADRDARDRSEYEIGPVALRAAWDALVPGLAAERPETPAGPIPAVRAGALRLLDDIVAAKSSAYTAYNEVDGEGEEAMKLLVFNINRFYARQPLSKIRRERRAFVAAFEKRLDAFASALLSDADRSAAAAGHALLRAGDATSALQQRLPHEIDVFEDVHVFPHVPGDRVTLESFDCDSFRDFGLHWRVLRDAAHATPETARLPDPFAAEILAEGVSQYGVLLLRLAGEAADRDPLDQRLRIAALGPAAAEIDARAARHRATPAPARPVTRIASAATPRRTEAGAPWFTDVTAQSGIAFTHRSARWLGELRHKLLKTPPTFSGGGVAAEDVDADGDVDLLFVGGGGNALLLNDGAGSFRDATGAAGIEALREDGSHCEPRNPLIADFDNDGHQDLLITYAGDPHRLYRGLGGARFEDVTAGAGLGGQGRIGGPATVFDFDGDGLLDIYLASFGDYVNGAFPGFHRNNRNGLPNQLFRNVGDMRFVDVTEGSGTDDVGWTQAVSHVDFDRDGRQDLIVANDYGRNAFLRNLGDGRFENVAPRLGITSAFHSMNVGIADLNDDDHPDVYISNLATLVKDDKYTFPDVNTPLAFDLHSLAGMLVKESDMLYMSQLREGRLSGYAPSQDVERGATSTGWAWDAEFLDFDHDGDDDLYLVNGTNDYNTFSTILRDDEALEGRTLVLDHRRESNVFFLNEDGRLRNVSPRSGADLAINSRSTAYLDLEGDGDLDIAINNLHGPATLLRNDADKLGHWLELRLVGDPARGSNRDAIGARIVATTPGGRRIRREVQGGSGYLSMNPKRQHLGLGDAESVDVLVIWPDGSRQHLAGLAADRRYDVHQGRGATPRAAGL